MNEAATIALSTAAQASANGDVLKVVLAVLTVATGLLGVLLRHVLSNRKLTIEENSGLRKEFIEEMQALRDESRGLRDEVHGLRDENSALRDQVRALRGEGDLMRREIRELHGTIDGLRRGTLQASMSAESVLARGVMPTGGYSIEMQDAVDRLDKLSGTANLPETSDG